ncbi:MAG: hypothetical protein JJU13_10775 [Balneolaceae bacterium]|nr:hypothetical protein [Balneolaceae bacterium]
MKRQSISFTKPNNDWLQAQVASEEYSSKSELVNDLIRKERKRQDEVEWIRSRLIEAERKGFTEEGRDEILRESKNQLQEGAQL